MDSSPQSPNGKASYVSTTNSDTFSSESIPTSLNSPKSAIVMENEEKTPEMAISEDIQISQKKIESDSNNKKTHISDAEHIAAIPETPDLTGTTRSNTSKDETRKMPDFAEFVSNFENDQTEDLNTHIESSKEVSGTVNDNHLEFTNISLSAHPEFPVEITQDANSNSSPTTNTNSEDNANSEANAQPIVDGEPLQESTEEEQNPVLASFMSACQNGDLAVVEELISQGKVSALDTFSQGITGLHWAAINNRITVVKYLVENPYSQADPNILGGTLAASPLHWACRNGLVYVVDYLLSHTNANPTLKDSQQYNALHLAVHSSNITLVLYILLKCVMIDRSIYIDEPDNIQCTALHWASYQGDILTVKALLHYGADVSKLDQSQMTPLHWGFIRGYKSVLAALLEAGSDFFHKNDKNKDSFGVSVDMNCEATWLHVLNEADRDPKKNWAVKSHLISPKAAKLITFFTPYATLPVALQMCSFSEGYAIPKLFFSVLLFAASIFFLQTFVVPIYLRKDKALFQTPYLAGLFSATANWAILSWVFVIFPTVWLKKFFTNVLLAAAIIAFTYSFFKAMTINPGHVPVPTDPRVVFDDVKALVSLGKFDTEHFCVNTFTRKPLRSKFSKTSGALIARFDHYCPWVYNDIGVRNHKLFMTFVYSLSTAIILFSSLAKEYFEEYAEGMGYASDVEDLCALFSDEMCLGFTYNHFIFNLMIWCWIQGIWIMFLCVVQTFQICKGLTTWEFSSLNKQMSKSGYNHSTVPGDFQGPNGAQTQPPVHSHRQKNGFGTCMKLLGIDQFSTTLKVGLLLLLKKTTHNDNYTSLESFDIPTDFGWKQNWLDFWFIGDIEWRNLFYLPIDGDNNLNGRVVDYYKLYEYPAKATGAEAV